MARRLKNSELIDIDEVVKGSFKRVGHNLIEYNCKFTKLLHVRYTHTDIITFHSDHIIIKTDGYRTLTTKKHINDYISSYRFHLYQMDYTWYITDKNKKIYEFVENMVLGKDGLVYDNNIVV